MACVMLRGCASSTNFQLRASGLLWCLRAFVLRNDFARASGYRLVGPDETWCSTMQECARAVVLLVVA
jgi:hypothetical protein